MSALSTVANVALRCPFLGAKMVNTMLTESPAATEIMMKTCPFLGGMCNYKDGKIQSMDMPDVASWNNINRAHPQISMDDAKKFMEKCPFSKVLIGENIQEYMKKEEEEEEEEEEVESFSHTARLTHSFHTPSPSPFQGVDFIEISNKATKVEPVKVEIVHQPAVCDLYADKFRKVVSSLKDEGRYRVFTTIERHAGEFPYASRFSDMNYDALEETKQFDEDVVVWCSNDYLGMGQNEVVTSTMIDTIKRMGAGSGGTRNIAGTTIEHVRLENELSSLHQKDGALVFGSCYVANVSAIVAIGSIMPNCVIFSDAKNHASLIEGIRNSKLEKKIFRHNDVAHLEELLKEADPSVPKLVIFESVYSMDGTIAPIAEICDVSKKYKAITFIDEVHAVGLYGEHGAGVAEERKVMHRCDIISGTLGKAFGVYGGYIASKNYIIDAVRCLSSGFIFTTSLPPGVIAGARASVAYLKKSQAERDHHKVQTKTLKSSLVKANLPVMETPSHIIPLMIGNAALAKQISNRLLERHNLYLQPINYPTVPKGSERFRLTCSPTHSMKEITHLVAALVECWSFFGLPFGPYVKPADVNAH